MVVGVAEIGLEDVVVDVLRRHLGVRAVEVHGLQLEHHDRAGGVLGERLVDADADLRSRRHLPMDEVGADELPRHVLGHASTLDTADAFARFRRGAASDT